MRTAAAGLLASCLIIALCPPVHADPPPSSRDVRRAREIAKDRARELGTASARLVAAQSRLARLDAEVERLVEAYNGERVEVARAGQAYEQAKTRLTAADAAVAQAREAVAALAAQAYGGMTPLEPVIGMMIDTGGVDGYLHRAGILDQLGDQRAAVLTRMRDAQEVSAILRTQAATAYAAQQAALERAGQAKHAAQAAVARQRRETRTLRARKSELQRRVDAARGRAELLARQRAAAISLKGLVGGSAMGDLAANWALSQLGKPYVWAADGPASYDCSGLTMRAWERVGVRLDHWTGTQWTSGPHVPLDQLQRGDLVFFGRISSDPGTIHHVGMYVGRGLMVHAPQTGDVVRVASIWRGDLVGATRPR
ncbi:C40 family peptidase [Nonomuraea sp. NN258]|uniref:C40 family peptidase n=1 Tax=Nonomuraea antri TaxID=2730852 RepID=UPI0015699709|nr:C40 family peptidase [Nonomuraea antri]NRQ36452.1 C40 family peptidase [Nonomuraea antri]